MENIKKEIIGGSMTEEKIFTIPLKNVFEQSRKKRAERAIRLIKDFLKKHTKTEQVHIGDSINKYIWKHGMQVPPRSIRVHTLKDKNITYAEIVGTEIKIPIKEDKKQKVKKEKIKKKHEETEKKTETQQAKAVETQKPQDDKKPQS